MTYSSRSYSSRSYGGEADTSNHILLDRVSNEEVWMSAVLVSLPQIFSIPSVDIKDIFLDWTHSQLVLLNNRLVEMQERLYREGFDINLSMSQMCQLIEEEKALSERYQLSNFFTGFRYL